MKIKLIEPLCYIKLPGTYKGETFTNYVIKLAPGKYRYYSKRVIHKTVFLDLAGFRSNIFCCSYKHAMRYAYDIIAMIS